MKAYSLSIKDDQNEAGEAIVFAATAREAKKQVWGHETLVDALEGGWIALRVNRAKRYDGMEKLSPAELGCKQWRDGWTWFDMDTPNEEEASDAEFIEWYEDVFSTH